MTIGIPKKVTIHYLGQKEHKEWIILVNGDEPFGHYRTKAALVEDAKKYGITLKAA